MEQELRTPLGFVGLADRRRHVAETAERAQEPEVGPLRPSHVSRAPPTVGAQRVETTVVPDPIGGVPLDRVATEITQFGPPLQKTWGGAHHLRDRGPTLRLGQRQSSFEPLGIIEGGGGENRGRNPRGELDRLIAHGADRTDSVHLGIRSCSRPLPYDAGVFAITLDAAKNVAIAVAATFLIGAVLAAWLMKTILQKVAVALVLAILAFAVWSQRTSLQECADKVQAAYSREGTDVTLIDTECSFFGATITISDPRDDGG